MNRDFRMCLVLLDISVSVHANNNEQYARCSIQHFIPLQISLVSNTRRQKVCASKNFSEVTGLQLRWLELK